MKLISYIIPVYNEDKNIPLLYKELKKFFGVPAKAGDYDYEIIFINDGSTDKSSQVIDDLASRDSKVKYIEFSRNFGKEIAITAGLNYCKGDAAICLDADLQHPIDKIPNFLLKWENGAEVVVGVRNRSKSEGPVKRFGSWLFYKIMSRISETQVKPNSTDFRLLDRKVINEFNRLTEKNRLTRGLIDWLGFHREYIYFEADQRKNSEPAYSYLKLVRLALYSFVSLSLFPLRIAGYLGIFITLTSGVFGLYILIADKILHITNFSWPAILAIIILFLIGIVLTCLGLIALYIANIHTEVINRPIYVVRKLKL
ncbi:MAG: glycosyltransferase family 2 protein [Patescibacteria group bacterium]